MRARKYGKSSGDDALFVKRQDELRLVRAQEVIAVLDPLGNAFAEAKLADGIALQQRIEFLGRDFSIDRHEAYCAAAAGAPAEA